MKKFYTLAAAAIVAAMVMIPEDASARPFGGGGLRGGGGRGGFGGGGWRGGGFRGGGWGGGVGGVGGAAAAGAGRGWGGGWGWGGGALAAGALIGAAAASSYYPYGYGGYYGGCYAASYGYGYGGCGQQLAWIQGPYGGWRRAGPPLPEDTERQRLPIARSGAFRLQPRTLRERRKHC